MLNARLRVRVPVLGGLLFCAACSAVPNHPLPQLLEDARRFHRAKEYKKAVRYTVAITTRHPGTVETEEAGYIKADSYRRLRKGNQAFLIYKDLLTKFPFTRFGLEVAQGEFELGRDFIQGKMPRFLIFGAQRAAGIEVLEHMQIHFRNHSLADDALMLVGDFELEEGLYDSAAETYKRVLSEYPRSEHRLKARFQLANAYLLRSEGAVYDERLLKRAEGAFKDFVAVARRMDGGAERYAKQINTARKKIASIREELAQHQLNVARFYRRRGQPRAATIYYRYCAREYPDTPSGKSAAKQAGLLYKPQKGQEGEASE